MYYIPDSFIYSQVCVGLGFGALGAVLWTALLLCQTANDVHTAKIIMMLSQVYTYTYNYSQTNIHIYVK